MNSKRKGNITAEVKLEIIDQMIGNWLKDSGISRKPSDQRAFLWKLQEIINMEGAEDEQQAEGQQR